MCTPGGGSSQVWALLDTGSTNTFITENLASKLNLSCTPVEYHINTISDSVENISSMVNFKVSSLENRSFDLNNVMVVKHIPAKWPVVDFDLKRFPFLDGLTLSKFSSTCHADILIGVDNANLMKPLQVVSGDSLDDPYAMLTALDYMWAG